jgi:hypothetical protein
MRLSLTVLGVTPCVAGSLVALIAVGCTRHPRDDEGARLAAEDAVLAAVLSETAGLLPPRAIAGDTIWLRQDLNAFLSHPAEGVDLTAWEPRWPDVPRGIARDFRSAQRRGRRLARLPVVDSRPIRFNSDPSPVVGAARWVAEVSRVGFNATLDSAIVQVSVVCGPVCGHGRTVLLAHTGGWTIVQTLSMVEY